MSNIIEILDIIPKELLKIQKSPHNPCWFWSLPVLMSCFLDRYPTAWERVIISKWNFRWWQWKRKAFNISRYHSYHYLSFGFFLTSILHRLHLWKGRACWMAKHYHYAITISFFSIIKDLKNKSLRKVYEKLVTALGNTNRQFQIANNSSPTLCLSDAFICQGI